MDKPAPHGNALPDGFAREHDHHHCIDHALQTAAKLCKQRGLRLTAIRRRVLELVWTSHQPLGAYAILDVLQQAGRPTAPPTVYRALDFLLEHGMVHRISSLNAFVGCDRPGDRHTGQFLICKQCRTTAELDDALINQTISDSAGKLGFAIDQQTIEILGLCPDCQQTLSQGTAT